jgi:hypothetical protein
VEGDAPDVRCFSPAETYDVTVTVTVGPGTVTVTGWPNTVVVGPVTVCTVVRTVVTVRFTVVV